MRFFHNTKILVQVRGAKNCPLTTQELEGQDWLITLATFLLEHLREQMQEERINL